MIAKKLTITGATVNSVPYMADQEPALMPGIILSDLVIREAGNNHFFTIGCFQRF